MEGKQRVSKETLEVNLRELKRQYKGNSGIEPEFEYGQRKAITSTAG